MQSGSCSFSWLKNGKQENENIHFQKSNKEKILMRKSISKRDKTEAKATAKAKEKVRAVVRAGKTELRNHKGEERNQREDATPED